MISEIECVVFFFFLFFLFLNAFCVLCVCLYLLCLRQRKPTFLRRKLRKEANNRFLHSRAEKLLDEEDLDRLWTLVRQVKGMGLDASFGSGTNKRGERVSEPVKCLS